MRLIPTSAPISMKFYRTVPASRSGAMCDGCVIANHCGRRNWLHQEKLCDASLHRAFSWRGASPKEAACGWSSPHQTRSFWRRITIPVEWSRTKQRQTREPHMSASSTIRSTRARLTYLSSISRRIEQSLIKARLRFQWVLPATPDFVRRRIAQDAIQLLQSTKLHHVKRCPGSGDCGWLFFDTSKNATHRRCSREGAESVPSCDDFGAAKSGRASRNSAKVLANNETHAIINASVLGLTGPEPHAATARRKFKCH